VKQRALQYEAERKRQAEIDAAKLAIIPPRSKSRVEHHEPLVQAKAVPKHVMAWIWAGLLLLTTFLAISAALIIKPSACPAPIASVCLKASTLARSEASKAATFAEQQYTNAKDSAVHYSDYLSTCTRNVYADCAKSVAVLQLLVSERAGQLQKSWEQVYESTATFVVDYSEEVMRNAEAMLKSKDTVRLFKDAVQKANASVHSWLAALGKAPGKDFKARTPVENLAEAYRIFAEDAMSRLRSAWDHISRYGAKTQTSAVSGLIEIYKRVGEADEFILDTLDHALESLDDTATPIVSKLAIQMSKVRKLAQQTWAEFGVEICVLAGWALVMGVAKMVM
jgi:hypothetical protein